MFNLIENIIRKYVIDKKNHNLKGLAATKRKKYSNLYTIKIFYIVFKTNGVKYLGWFLRNHHHKLL